MAERLSQETTQTFEHASGGNTLPPRNEAIEAIQADMDAIRSRLAEAERKAATPGFKATANDLVDARLDLRDLRSTEEPRLHALEEMWSEYGGSAIEEAQEAVDELNFKADATDRVAALTRLNEAKDAFYERLSQDFTEPHEGSPDDHVADSNEQRTTDQPTTPRITQARDYPQTRYESDDWHPSEYTPVESGADNVEDRESGERDQPGAEPAKDADRELSEPELIRLLHDVRQLATILEAQELRRKLNQRALRDALSLLDQALVEIDPAKEDQANQPATEVESRPSYLPANTPEQSFDDAAISTFEIPAGAGQELIRVTSEREDQPEANATKRDRLSGWINRPFQTLNSYFMSKRAVRSERAKDSTPERRSKRPRRVIGALALVGVGLTAYLAAKGFHSGGGSSARDHVADVLDHRHVPSSHDSAPNISVPRPEYSTDALTIRPGEGWYDTMQELGVKDPGVRHELLQNNTLMSRLQGMGLAYKSQHLGGWGVNMTPNGEMPKEALDLIARASEEAVERAGRS